MFKTLNIFRITSGWNHEPDTGTMEDMAHAMPFTSCSATQDKSVGWVPPRVYVNSTMPNGSQEYWQRAMSWGR